MHNMAYPDKFGARSPRRYHRALLDEFPLAQEPVITFFGCTAGMIAR